MNLKNIFSGSAKLAVALSLILVFTQCKEEDYTGYSTLNATNPAANLDWTAPASMMEQDAVYPFTINLDQAQVVDVAIDIIVDGASTATEGEDFDLSTHTLIIPAYATSASGELAIYGDNTPEGTETIVLKIGDESTANAAFTPQTVSVELTNFVGSDVQVVFDWASTPVTVDGVEYDLCDHVDLDVYVLDTGGNDLGNYDAATGDCPEIMDLSPDTWADGTYILSTNLWYNDLFPADGSALAFPITMYFTQAGVYENASVMQDPSTVIDSTVPDYYNGGADFFDIVRVEVSGGNFSFFNAVTNEPLF